jgi:hypothetical protein
MATQLFVENMLKDSLPRKTCDVAYFDDSVFQYYLEQLNAFPAVADLVVLDIWAGRSLASKEAIDKRVTAANPSLFWHSSAHHYTASTMIMDFDSNGTQFFCPFEMDFVE